MGKMQDLKGLKPFGYNIQYFETVVFIFAFSVAFTLEGQ
jgi:hypothetical protein